MGPAPVSAADGQPIPSEESLIGDAGALRFGSIQTDWKPLHGTGEYVIRPEHIRTSLSEEFVELPEDLDLLRESMRKDLENIVRDGRSDVWNGKRFSLVRAVPARFGDMEATGLSLDFKLTDYAAFLALNERLDEQGLVELDSGEPVTIRKKYYLPDSNQPDPNLTHSLGVNLVVISQDGKIMFTQRSDFVALSKGLFDNPVVEGMQYPQDVDEFGRPSFTKTATRGLWEELGIELNSGSPDVARIEFLNFGVRLKSNQYALLGRVTTDLTSAEIRERFYLRARDRGMETRHRLYVVDHHPRAILDLMNAHAHWGGNCLATVYFAMVREWGFHSTRSILSKYSFQEHLLAPQ